MPAATIATLLEGTWKKLKREYRMYLMLIVPFGIVCMLVWGIFGAYTEIERNAMAARLGIDASLLMEYDANRHDDPESLAKAKTVLLQTLTEHGVQNPGETLNKEMKTYSMHILPWGILTYILTVMLFVWGYIAFFLLATGKKKKVRDALRSSGSLILPFICVSMIALFYVLALGGIWLFALFPFLPAFLRSFLVLLIVGLTVNIIPRVGFAHIIYLKEQKGILHSAYQAMKATRGYWWKIVGNSVLLILLVSAVFVGFILCLGAVVALGAFVVHDGVFSLIVTGVTSILAAVGIIVMYIGIFLYASLFKIELVLTILAHPKKK